MRKQREKLGKKRERKGETERREKKEREGERAEERKRERTLTSNPGKLKGEMMTKL